jgi:cytochrome c peroxidase
MSSNEVKGLKLFVREAHCIDCHSGPLFTNREFHNTGVPQTLRSVGRLAGIGELRHDEFKFLGRYSDPKPAECAMQFLPLASDRLRGAFKPPSLRNVTRRAP